MDECPPFREILDPPLEAPEPSHSSIPKPPVDENVDGSLEAKRPKLHEKDQSNRLLGQNKTSGKSNFTWKISNFSQLTSQKLYSDTFIVSGCLWRLLLFREGNNVDHLSIYLDVADSSKLPNGWSRDAQFSCAVINQSNNNATLTKEVTWHVFCAKEDDWGIKKFISLRKLKDPVKRYLIKDTLTLEAKVLVRSVVHYSKVESEKERTELTPKEPELAVRAPPNQTPLTTKKEVAPSVIDTPLTTIDPLNQTKGISELVKPSGDVQTVCKGLITELSSRKRTLKSVSGQEILDPISQKSSPDIQQQQKEALLGFFNMSLESVQQSNCFDKIEGILRTLVQHTDNLQEKTILEDIISCLAEFKQSIPRAKVVVETSQALKESLVGKTVDLDTKLEQRQKELSSLESDFSILSEEEAKLEGEIQQLMAKKEEVVTRKKSVSFKLEIENKETCKDMEEWKSLEGEIKKANGEWLGGKEELASANVRWKLFREEALGLGNLKIS